MRTCTWFSDTVYWIYDDKARRNQYENSSDLLLRPPWQYKKVLDAIARRFHITLIDAVKTDTADLAGYDLIGFASGIYYSKFHKCVLQFAERNLPAGKKVFFLYTCGVEKKGYTEAIAKAVKDKKAVILGEYGCLGFNTFGPFKLIGGIAKGRPDEEDLDNAVRFYADIAAATDPGKPYGRAPRDLPRGSVS